LLEKAAILLERLARNHPLPDGNKRTSFLMTARFLEVNESPLHDTLPDVDVPMVEKIAAGQVELAEVVACLSERIS
jgi:death on curing protein